MRTSETMIQDQQSSWARCATQAFRRAAKSHPLLGSDAQSSQQGTARQLNQHCDAHLGGILLGHHRCQNLEHRERRGGGGLQPKTALPHRAKQKNRTQNGRVATDSATKNRINYCNSVTASSRMALGVQSWPQQSGTWRQLWSQLPHEASRLVGMPLLLLLLDPSTVKVAVPARETRPESRGACERTTNDTIS